jgi:hypothetical protein
MGFEITDLHLKRDRRQKKYDDLKKRLSRLYAGLEELKM